MLWQLQFFVEVCWIIVTAIVRGKEQCYFQSGEVSWGRSLAVGLELRGELGEQESGVVPIDDRADLTKHEGRTEACADYQSDIGKIEDSLVLVLFKERHKAQDRKG